MWGEYFLYGRGPISFIVFFYLNGCYQSKNTPQLPAVRPFLTQSDSASRKRPFSAGIFVRLDFSGPSYRQSSRFYSFCALPRGGWCEGVLLYDSRNRLAALCFAISPPATARRTLVPASWWLWA